MSYLFRLIMMGDLNVGKTTTLKTFLNQKKVELESETTVSIGYDVV